jgi:uncharacterized protein
VPLGRAELTCFSRAGPRQDFPYAPERLFRRLPVGALDRCAVPTDGYLISCRLTVPTEHILGVISDTHGLVRPEALAALVGVEQILHAGDVGAPEVLAALARIAPVVAVRGNNDKGLWAKRLRQTETITIVGVRIFVLHDVKELAVDPAAAGVSAVIAGHSHRPAIEERGGVLFFNPGSAGPRRFKLPVAVGKLYVAPGAVRAEIVRLG